MRVASLVPVPRIVAPLVSLLVILAIWAAIFRADQIPSMVLPSPADTARALIDGFRTGSIWSHLLATFEGAAIGYAIGVGLALILAALFTAYPLAERFLMLHVLAFQAIPTVAIAPLVFIWCGFGIRSTVVIVTIACFYPVFINSLVGFRATDATLTDMYRAFGSSELRIFWTVRLPAAARQIFVGLEISIVFAFTAAVVMEFIAGTQGLGYLIQTSSVTLNSAEAFAALIVLALLGITTSGAIRAVRRRLIFWELGPKVSIEPMFRPFEAPISTCFAASITSLVLISTWVYFTGPGGMPPTVLPSPISVIRALHMGLTGGQLWPHIMFTTRAALAGLVLGGLLGLFLGAAIVLTPTVEPFVMPIVVGLQSVPKIALAPLIIWYLGIGIESKIMTAALLCFFPIFVATANGMRSLSPELVDLYRAASASRLHVLVNVRFPAAAPYLFSALQIAVVLSLTGTVVAEFIVSSQGLGYIIRARSQELDLSMGFAAVAVLSLVGIIGSFLVRVAHRKLVFWQAS